MDNHTIAEQLNEYARVLEAEGGSVFRVRAYRRAAEVIRDLGRPLQELVAEQGRAGLEAIPGIGNSLSYTIEGLVRDGEFRTARPADGELEPLRLLTSLPGVGPRTAEVLHDRLGIATLEELERAAEEGRLAEAGIGPKRARGLRDVLAGRLQRSAAPEPVKGEPDLEDLLAVEAAYREQAEQHRLPTLAPRRFNPEGERWLPIWRTERGGWRYRVLFSNTALAHRLGRTRDWVVLYFENDFHSGQRTVVTETRGDLAGRRVVRGRERECRAHYQGAEPAA
jgi:hypothetical protein